MIREAHISLQSFTLGLGVLSYLIASCGGQLGLLGVWLGHYLWAYCGLFYLAVNVLLLLLYRGDDWQVSGAARLRLGRDRERERPVALIYGI